MCVGSGPTLCGCICSEQLGWLALGPGLVEDRGLQGPGWYRRAHSPVGIPWAPMSSRAPKAPQALAIRTGTFRAPVTQQGERSLLRWRQVCGRPSAEPSVVLGRHSVRILCAWFAGSAWRLRALGLVVGSWGLSGQGCAG